jgi:hypothetical protein
MKSYLLTALSRRAFAAGGSGVARVILYIAAGVALLPGGAHAAPAWGLLPTSLTVTAGQPFQLDLVVSGLGDGTAPSLGGFDVDITFSDVFTIDPTAVVFGALLGDPNNPAETQTTAALIGTEVLFLREDSFLSGAALDAMQGSSFSLATLTFTGSSLGTFIFAGDDFSGGLFLTDGTTVKPGVDIATVNVIPVPAAVWLFGSALGLLGWMRRNRA